MAYTILHSADLHLDRSFGALPTAAARSRRAALRRRLEGLVGLAAEQHVDAITIGGDLYEAATAAPDLDAFLVRCFASALRPVFLVGGNHDPVTAGSLYRRVAWPGNLRLFASGVWEVAPLAPGLELWGTSFTGPERRENPFQTAPRNDAMRLALLHGSAETAGEASPYGPFAPGDPAAAGFAITLLGHVHQGRADRPGPHPTWIYPGSPEPLDFGETGERRALLVTVDVAARTVTVRPLPLETTRFYTSDLPLEGRAGPSEVLVAARALGAEHPEWRGHYVRLRARGRATLVDWEDLGVHLAAEIGAEVALLEDHTVTPWDVEALVRERTIRGAFVRRLQRRLAEAPAEERGRWERALAYGLDALAGVPVGPR